jgi:hypothetical protein
LLELLLHHERYLYAEDGSLAPMIRSISANVTVTSSLVCTLKNFSRATYLEPAMGFNLHVGTAGKVE